MFKNSYIPHIKLFIISFFIISFIFLSGIKYNYFQLRFSILLLLIPCAFKFYSDVKIRNYNFLIQFSLLFTILFTHTSLNLYYEKVDLTNYSLLGTIFLLSLFTICYYYFDYINHNIDFIIKFFIIIFLSSCLYSIYDYQSDADFFCGGISAYIKSSTMLEELYPFYGNRIGDVRLSFKEFIFTENSHLGMIAPSILAYSIYKMTNQKLSILENFFIIIFIIICFIKSSTTLYVGTVLSLLLIIFSNFKALNIKTLISFFILIVFFITILLSNKECRARFVPVYSTMDENYITPDSLRSDDVVGGIDENLAYKIKDIMNTGGNLSSGVYFHALKIAKNSIIERPFGWGINRYNQAFNYFNEKDPASISRINTYNNKDGTNNVVKIVVEFGIFSILFYLFCFLFLINSKIPIELKLFYLPFIITQSVRGAGYFNSGFLLIVFIMLFTYINIYKKI